MKKQLTALLVGAMLLSSLLAGCGGGSTTIENPSNQTLGQELIDLDEAFKAGIITEREYKKAKKGLLEKYN